MMVEEPELVIKTCNLSYIDFNNINQHFGLNTLYTNIFSKYGLEMYVLPEDVLDRFRHPFSPPRRDCFKVGSSKWNYFLEHIQDARIDVLKQFCYLYLQLVSRYLNSITKSNRRIELGMYIDSIKIYLDNIQINYPLNNQSNYYNFEKNFTNSNYRIDISSLIKYMHFKEFDFNFKNRYRYNVNCITELFKLIKVIFKYRKIDNITNVLLISDDYNNSIINLDFFKDRPYITDDDIIEFCFNNSLNLRRMINYKYTDIGTVQITFD